MVGELARWRCGAGATVAGAVRPIALADNSPTTTATATVTATATATARAVHPIVPTVRALDLASLSKLASRACGAI